MLQKICGAGRALPVTYDVFGTLSFSDKSVIGQGGFCDVYKGSLSTEVCVKRLRTYAIGDKDTTEEVPLL